MHNDECIMHNYMFNYMVITCFSLFYVMFNRQLTAIGAPAPSQRPNNVGYQPGRG